MWDRKQSATAIKLILLHGRSDDCIQSCLARVYQHLRLMLSSVVATELNHVHRSRSAAPVRSPKLSELMGNGWEIGKRRRARRRMDYVPHSLMCIILSHPEPRRFSEVDDRPWEMWLCWPICSKCTRKPLHLLSPNTSSTCKTGFVISACSTSDARFLLLPPPFFFFIFFLHYSLHLWDT